VFTVNILTLTYRCVTWLWALPLTLLGLCVWVTVYFERRIFNRKSAVTQVKSAQAAIIFVAYSNAVKWLLVHHPFGRMDAITIGCCVLACDAAALQRTWTHECVHVRQALQWGPLFPLAYAASSAWAGLRGRCMYEDNYFEKQACLHECMAPHPVHHT
jgi:hypothetical protein